MPSNPRIHGKASKDLEDPQKGLSVEAFPWILSVPVVLGVYWYAGFVVESCKNATYPIRVGIFGRSWECIGMQVLSNLAKIRRMLFVWDSLDVSW